MEQERNKKLHLIYGCVLSVLLVAVALALIVSCLHIYHSGDRPYSPASIGDHYRNIAFIVYLALAAIVGGIAIGLIFPIEKQHPKAIKDDLALLQKQQHRCGTLTGSYARASDHERKNRIQVKLMCGIAFVAIMTFPALYFLDLGHFTVARLNQDIVKALLYTLIPSIEGLLLCYCCELFCQRSILREIEIWKEAIKAGATAPSQETPKPDHQKRTLYLRVAVGTIALLFIVIGIFNGGAMDVLLKAIAICTECIGLG